MAVVGSLAAFQFHQEAIQQICGFVGWVWAEVLFILAFSRFFNSTPAQTALGWVLGRLIPLAALITLVFVLGLASYIMLGN
jgi:hypothetical protein